MAEGSTSVACRLRIEMNFVFVAEEPLSGLHLSPHSLQQLPAFLERSLLLQVLLSTLHSGYFFVSHFVKMYSFCPLLPSSSCTLAVLDGVGQPQVGRPVYS